MSKLAHYRQLFLHKLSQQEEKAVPPFWVLVQKELADHIRSWRVILLVMLLALTCFASLYTALSAIHDVASELTDEDHYLFLKLFTVSDQSLPPFFIFISFIGPLLGIALGFDAVNAEWSKRTLSRLVSQPIPRDYVINAKFVAALLIISTLIFGLGFLVMGLGLIIIGIPPTPEEFLRVISFLLLSICYIAFWLNLAILFSIQCSQAATSALSSLSVWLYFTVFHSLIINMLHSALQLSEQTLQSFMRFAPSQLFSEATTTLLTPTVRALGPLSMEQIVGAIPSSLPLTQSLLLITPHLFGLVAATLVCFAFSYVLFMRKEIRN